MSRKRCYTAGELANIIIEDIPFGNTSDIVILIYPTQKMKTYLLLQTNYKLNRKIKLETYVLLKMRKTYLKTMKI